MNRGGSVTIEKFIPPAPSDEAVKEFRHVYSNALSTTAVALDAAYAIDVPPVCRAEVEAFAEYAASKFFYEHDKTVVRKAMADWVLSYGPASDGPAPEVACGMEGFPPVKEVVETLSTARTVGVGPVPLSPPSPRWQDAPETLAFLQMLAEEVDKNWLPRDADIARAFLALLDRTRGAE